MARTGLEDEGFARRQVKPARAVSSTPAQVNDRTSTVRHPDVPIPETPEANVKKTLIAAVLSLGLLGLCSSCLGPNRLWNQLHDWNKDFSEERWANEGIFVALHVLPLYPLAYLGDIVVFNSVEWWGGDPMVNYEKSRELKDTRLRNKK